MCRASANACDKNSAKAFSLIKSTGDSFNSGFANPGYASFDFHFFYIFSPVTVCSGDTP